MSGPVDVLLVMDAAAADKDCSCGHPRCGRQRERAELLEARAAVAELIEKSAAALHYMRLHKYAEQAWPDDLAAALARVQGGRADG